MKWKINTGQPFDYREWHLWFAWKPVEIKGYMHWLCFLHRRAKFTHQTFPNQQKMVIRTGQGFYWQYTEPVYYS